MHRVVSGLLSVPAAARGSRLTSASAGNPRPARPWSSAMASSCSYPRKAASCSTESPSTSPIRRHRRDSSSRIRSRFPARATKQEASMMGSADRGEPQSVTDAALLANALLGGGLPPEAEFHLWEAGLSYHLDEVAEHHLREAQALAPGHAAVLIGLYRFYFYKGRLADALTIAKLCLEEAAHENRLAADWQQVAAGDAEFGRYENMLPRFYLFTLKGYAYLQMRLGNLDEGRAAVMKLLELDPSDKVGARVLLDVLNRMGLDEDG